jgi:hypothetical protein
MILLKYQNILTFMFLIMNIIRNLTCAVYWLLRLKKFVIAFLVQNFCCVLST